MLHTRLTGGFNKVTLFQHIFLLLFQYRVLQIRRTQLRFPIAIVIDVHRRSKVYVTSLNLVGTFVTSKKGIHALAVVLALLD